MRRERVSSEQKQAWMRERNSAASALPAPASPAIPVHADRHYRVADVVSMWSIGSDTVRKIFQDEPGVLVLGGSGRGRQYRTLLIPAVVLERVHRRLANVG